MSVPEITVQGVHLCSVWFNETVEIVGKWRAKVGEFNIRGGSIRLDHETGKLTVVVPGKRPSGDGIGLQRGGQVWPALEAWVLALYEDERKWRGR